MHRRSSRISRHAPLIGTLSGLGQIALGAGFLWLAMAWFPRQVGPAPPVPWFMFGMPVGLIVLGVLILVHSVPAISPPLTRSVAPARLSAHARSRLQGMLSRRASGVLHWTLLRTAPRRYASILAAIGTVLLLVALDGLITRVIPTDIRLAALFGLPSIAIATALAAVRPAQIAGDAFLRRRFPDHCPRCAHRTGSTVITACPECGQAMGEPRPERPPRRRRRRRRRRHRSQSASNGRSKVSERSPN